MLRMRRKSLFVMFIVWLDWEFVWLIPVMVVTIQNGSESSLIEDVKTKQDMDPSLVDLKKSVGVKTGPRGLEVTSEWRYREPPNKPLWSINSMHKEQS